MNDKHENLFYTYRFLQNEVGFTVISFSNSFDHLCMYKVNAS